MAHTDHKSIQESKEGSASPSSMEGFQHIVNKEMGIQNEKKMQSFKQWMSYRGFEKFTDMCNAFSYMLDNIHDHSEHKFDGLRHALNFGTMNKLRLIIRWMFTSITDSTLKLYAEDLLALTIEQLDNFRQEDMISMARGPKYPLPCPTTPMTTFIGHTKGTTASEPQISLKNFKKGTKRDASAFPIFKNDLYHHTLQRSFLATIKAQGLSDVVDPDFDPDDGDQYEKQPFLEKQSFVFIKENQSSPNTCLCKSQSIHQSLG